MPLPAGQPWVAPDGTEYIVVKESFSEPTFPPEVRPAETEIRFYRDDNVELTYRVPGFSFAIDLTDDRILEIFNAVRENGA